ncbi:MAG: hypothetical protein M3O88_04215, partial [Actinomycetota bacterium]|nr:hypothetical protein [Actinomycetota bacterium]
MLSAGALAIAVETMLSAVGWSPAAVGLCIAFFQVLILLAGAAARAFQRIRWRYPIPFMVTGALIALAELITPLGYSVGAQPAAVSQWWVLGQLGSHVALPLFFVLAGGGLARGLMDRSGDASPRWSTLRATVLVALASVLGAAAVMGGALGVSALRSGWTVGSY